MDRCTECGKDTKDSVWYPPKKWVCPDCYGLDRWVQKFGYDPRQLELPL